MVSNRIKLYAIIIDINSLKLFEFTSVLWIEVGCVWKTLSSEASEYGGGGASKKCVDVFVVGGETLENRGAPHNTETKNFL